MRTARILILAPFFPPLEMAESIVNGKLALALQDAGWDVQILSRPITPGEGRQYTVDWQEPWLKLKPLATYLNSGMEPIVAASRSLLARRFPFTDTAMRRLADINWARRAAAWAAEQHHRRPFDMVLTRSFPEVAHLAGLWIARRTGVKWIANWNDPTPSMNPSLTDNQKAGRLGRAATRIMRAVATEASWHTFPSEPLRQYIAEYMPADIRARSSVIPHVALNLLETLSAAKNTTMIMCHNGDLRLPRDPDSFFAGLAKFIQSRDERPRISIIICGLSDEHARESAKRHGIDGLVTVLGPRSYLQSQAVLSQADIAFLVEAPWKRAVFMPSKLADYVTLQKPVLAVTPADSAVAQLLETHGGGVVAPCGSLDAACRAISDLYESWRSNKLAVDFDTSRLYKQCSPETVIQCYEQLLTTV